MTYDEVCDLLGDIAAFDRRTLGDKDGEAWEAAVGDLPYADCRAAVVAHYRESTQWVMPAHIRERVNAMRTERLRAAGDLEAAIPPDLADRPLEYRAALTRLKQDVMDGRPAPKAIGSAK
jgi:hypothetical protein